MVRRIFDLRCQGYSYRKIATTLNAENVPMPTTFYYMRRDKPNIRKDGDFWAPPTVKSIPRNEVYLGHMVQNKTGNLSYKIHKQIAKRESEWIRVENTHELLISQETWDLVRELDARKAKFRSSKAGETALFTGVLFCMDCKSPMRHYRDGQKRKDGSPSTYQSYACNRYVTGGKTVYSGHIINQRVLIELLLIDIRFKAALAQNQPDTLRDKIMAQKNAAGLEQRKTLQATMDALDKRLTELEKLVVAAYEDKVKGAILEAVCVQLLKRYEDERTEKLEQWTKLSTQLEACQEDEKAADDWLALIRDYSKLEELDRPTLLRLVKRIEVGERKTVNGHDERDIKIYYNFVGFVEL